MMHICGILLAVFAIHTVLSQSPCDDSNAACQFHYHEGRCKLYTANGYEELSDQIFTTIQSKCNTYWGLIYSTNEVADKCTSSDKFIWPVGQCGCPLCDCPSDSFCCYDAPTTFDINNWNQNAAQISCSQEYDMCYYSVDAANNVSVSCSDTTSLNNRLSMNISSPLSTILNENNNTACYTFIESDHSTKLTCYCGDSGCNAVSNIIAPDLQPKNSCYVTDTFQNEQFWSNYVYQNNECEMCGISIASSNSQDGKKVELSCKSRANCQRLLSEYGEYNDRLSGCAVTLNTAAASNTSTYYTSTTECCCDPSIDGNLCNQNFLTTQPQMPSRSNFGCWKADFLTTANDNWNANAKRINCSYEHYKYCYIQSFGSNRYSSNCETESNCNNIKRLENNKRVCCNSTDFCNEPSVFKTSSAPNNSLCVVIVCVFIMQFVF